MYSYCLFCETLKCVSIKRKIEQFSNCRVIQPRVVQHTWSGGRPVDRENDLLPGYLFLYSEERLEEFSPFRRLDGVLRILGNRDDGYALSGSDEQFAMILLSMDGVIGKTPVYEEGQWIHLADRAFAGIEAKILKVNRRNKRMQIELPFADTLVKTWIEYEMVETDISAELNASEKPCE